MDRNMDRNRDRDGDWNLGPGRIARRRLLRGAGLGLVALVAGALGWRLWQRRAPVWGGAEIDPARAHGAARAGRILLVDIRRPEEWAATGIPEGAHPIDMRRPDFTQALARLRAAHPGRPVALICARGVRSAALARRLAAAGLGPVINLPEGMLGSRAGPGWLARGLPVAGAT